MILKRREFMARAHVDERTLDMWLSEEWLLPLEQGEDEEAYGEADLARARLIQELRQDLGVNDAGIGLALHLLDQVHGLRAALNKRRS